MCGCRPTGSASPRLTPPDRPRAPGASTSNYTAKLARDCGKRVLQEPKSAKELDAVLQRFYAAVRSAY